MALRQVKDLDQNGVRIALDLKSPARGSQVLKTLDTELASQLGALGKGSDWRGDNSLFYFRKRG